MALWMRAGLLLLLLNLVAASPRLKEDIKINPLDTLLPDMKITPLESLLVHSLELDIPPAELSDSTLDREQMVWRRKRGGLLQPDWLIRIIHPEKTDFERIVSYMMKLVREKELLRLMSLSGQENLERRTRKAQK